MQFLRLMGIYGGRIAFLRLEDGRILRFGPMIRRRDFMLDDAIRVWRCRGFPIWRAWTVLVHKVTGSGLGELICYGAGR